MWSADGKRPMWTILESLSIANKKYDQNKHSEICLREMKKSLGNELTKHIHNLGGNTPDCMYIDGLEFLVSNIGDIPGFATHNARHFRRDFISTLKAFENGDTSMVEDLGPNAAWPVNTPFSATSAPINTTNREAAVTGAPSASFAEMLARVSSVPTPPYGSSSKIDKIRSNMNGSGAPSAPTNVTHHLAAHLTSSIKPVHLSGLLALNPGPPSTSSSFSTPSVAESAEFTETNPEALRGLGIDASEQEAPDNSGMPDAADESEMEQNSTGAALSVPLQQVCLISKTKLFVFSNPKRCDFDPYHF